MDRLRRIVKTELVDEYGRALNPYTAFTRFARDKTGSKSYFGYMRALVAYPALVSMMVDWGLIDGVSRSVHQTNDGDRVWYPLRPQTWLDVATLAYLFVGMYAAGFKRKESETVTDSTRTYLFLWNTRVAIEPLVAANFILYFNALRWNASNDLANEFTLGFTFVAFCLEKLFGAYPSEWIDTVLPAILATTFVAFTVACSRFGVKYYTQLDWVGNPSLAASNAFVYLSVVNACAVVCVGLAKFRNFYYSLYLPYYSGV